VSYERGLVQLDDFSIPVWYLLQVELLDLFGKLCLECNVLQVWNLLLSGENITEKLDEQSDILVNEL
jgi:hypothetical protein